MLQVPVWRKAVSEGFFRFRKGVQNRVKAIFPVNSGAIFTSPFKLLASSRAQLKVCFFFAISVYSLRRCNENSFSWFILVAFFSGGNSKKQDCNGLGSRIRYCNWLFLGFGSTFGVF